MSYPIIFLRIFLPRRSRRSRGSPAPFREGERRAPALPQLESRPSDFLRNPPVPANRRGACEEWRSGKGSRCIAPAPAPALSSRRRPTTSTAAAALRLPADSACASARKGGSGAGGRDVVSLD